MPITNDHNIAIEATDVAIIGAGPAGSIAAGLLRQYGHRVTVLEHQHFPRFSIGESLLPQCMEFIRQAGMQESVNAAGFRFKNGAAFACGDSAGQFDFTEKFSAGDGTIFQVERAKFDHLLADGAASQGADVRYGHKVLGVTTDTSGARVEVTAEGGQSYTLQTRYLLDASGFGRVLPRLLDLDLPSTMPSRTSLLTHIEDNIDAGTFDRNKISIHIHPQQSNVWFWLIPFQTRCSVGVVAEDSFFQRYAHLEPKQRLQTIIAEVPTLSGLLTEASFDTEARQISGYACDVKSLYGNSYALLGNAGEFLDPVFSSGVTIAMKSAALIAPLVDRHLRGKTVDWQQEYATQLKQGVDTFRTYVEAFYDGRLQKIIFSDTQPQHIRAMISSILAGYAWDKSNPLVAKPEARLNAIYELCSVS